MTVCVPVLGPVAVCGLLFGCTVVGWASASVAALVWGFGWWVGVWCLSALDPPWLSLRFSLALTVCELWALFFVSLCCVNLIRVFLHYDSLHLLEGLHVS